MVYKSGIHAIISGVLLAFTTLIKTKDIEGKLSSICNLLILPLFVFTNTAINLDVNIDVSNINLLINGIVLDLVLGKLLGVMLSSYIIIVIL